MTIRLFARVRKPDIHPPLRHYVGMPADLNDSGEDQQVLPWPSAVVISIRPDGVFLDRYAPNGEPAGDTWHQSIEDAKHQAEQEYGELLGDWQEPRPNAAEEEVLARVLSA